MSEDKAKAIETKAEGIMDQGIGRLKDAAGGLTGNVGMQAEGKVDQLSGMARQEFADLYEEGEGKVERAVTFVRERPLFSLGIAAVLGTVIGLIFLPRRKG
ncbi:CsbD family protein [Komagataeibacter swingsii]|uniref:CsbD family protein n=1 Tax=Komagataeibacter swingsii TaxID=215220 RepID=A0A2V4RQ19_9PROT|nr:CsbD family protein [Komagataeibacter swingsii]AHI26127.1 putative general stress response protein [Komagataeibacter xylinus E25]RFP07126.1 general stress protein [Komagataeibacter xylinus]NVN35692.1 CsbD family protein [Komagataeibacter swingsii]PYD71240.1 CsbD family protein [Komagataeibacter swingsii]RFP07351.1 general stress protein [Komagataeibacter xylinus]